MRDLRLRFLAAATILVVWLVTLAAGVFALQLLEGERVPFRAIVFDTASALGNVGLSTGVATADATAGGQLVLVLLMWIGRLEIVALLVLVAARFPGRRPAR